MKVPLKFVFICCLLIAHSWSIADEGSSLSKSFATEACKSGCFIAKGGTVFFRGAVPQTYRVCALDAFDTKISVDGQRVPVNGIQFDIRYCVDVNGRELVALDRNVLVGRVPN